MKLNLYNFLLFLLFINSVFSWKKDEFRNCNQTPFCKRARSRKPGACSLIATDVSIFDGDLIAKLVPNDKVQENIHNQENPIVKPLVLTISAYQDGVLRLKIDEDQSLSPRKKRFQVPDVIVPEFLNKKLWLQKLKTEKSEDGLGILSVVYLSDGYEGVIRHDPFEVFARETGKNGKRVLSLNSNGLFDFEQLREKKGEHENWEERFRSHTDTRPYGPQSISFDVSFYDADKSQQIEEGQKVYKLCSGNHPAWEDASGSLRLDFGKFHVTLCKFGSNTKFVGEYKKWINDSHQGTSFKELKQNVTSVEVKYVILSIAKTTSCCITKSDDKEKRSYSTSDSCNGSNTSNFSAFIIASFSLLDVISGGKGTLKAYIQMKMQIGKGPSFSQAYHSYDLKNYKFYSNERLLRRVHLAVQYRAAALLMRSNATTHVQRLCLYRYEFRNCNQTPFCKRARSRKPGACSLIATDVSIFDGDLIAKLVPNDKVQENIHNQENPIVKPLVLTISAYQDGVLRLKIDEDQSLSPRKKRFQVPDVIVPEFLNKKLWLQKLKTEKSEDGLGILSVVYLSDGYEGVIRHDPFEVFARETGKNGKRVLSLNSNGLFDFEQLREKKGEHENWEERSTGADVGGFFGNSDTELLVRWYQVGAYYPFFRAHAHQDTRRREPWLFGERNTQLMRESIHTRYMFLPYFYTLFREANMTGVPVVRPLWMEFPDDEQTFSNDEAFMVGNSLLVQGIYTEKAKHVSVYLPGDQSWYDIRTGTAYGGGVIHKLEASEDSVPAFQRAGTIVPRKDRFRRSSTQMENDPYTLVIALNSSQAAGWLYVDDGKSFEFLQGAYIHRHFAYSDGKLTSSNLASTGFRTEKFASECIVERIILLGFSPGPKKALIEPVNEKVDIEPGPLLLRGGWSSSVLTIRKPNVRIADDWTIKIL
ncbi:probable glucan 1,3-alpha-glucosidase [Olea europaea var. sylvestris]|uniref:probable glucan 1,3-alpha-glucosidase n=1 Tax=Olea europaea var. sylvestris TaxID=158386 RepID=UPI000C1D3B0F|nr:probable glucan 1,3-alpha-glucosidase [Olea europaea var. sylvestris]